MKLELTKLGTFAAAELDTERNITGTIMDNVISAEECYVVQKNDLEDITIWDLNDTFAELYDKDDEKRYELRKEGITPNYLTQGTWQLCLVKVGSKHRFD